MRSFLSLAILLVTILSETLRSLGATGTPPSQTYPTGPNPFRCTSGRNQVRIRSRQGGSEGLVLEGVGPGGGVRVAPRKVSTILNETLPKTQNLQLGEAIVRTHKQPRSRM